MNWVADVGNALYLNFAVELDEVERLLPPNCEPERTYFQGTEWGFFTFLMFHNGLRSVMSPFPKLRFHQANLRIYLRDANDTPAVYFKRVYAPSFPGWVLKWFGTQPTRSMTFEFPSHPRPGGLYNWRIKNGGAVDVRGKIDQSQGATGPLVDMFETEEAMVEFFRQRPVAYFSPKPDAIHRVNVGLTHGDAHRFHVDNWEMGALAPDLQRHSFPDVLSGTFFVPTMRVEGGPVEQVEMSQITRT